MQQVYEFGSVPSIKGARVVILLSKWYREHTDRMVAKCIEVLKLAECAEPVVEVIPGSLEMPLAAQTLARATPPPEAIICIGAIMKGETLHFEMIVDECIRGLGRVMLDESVPIIVEVIPALNVDQLKARTADDEFNKGIEAALAAAEIIAWRRSKAQ